MTCHLCGNKPSWCECTQEAYQLAELKEEQQAKNDRLTEIERKIDLTFELLLALSKYLKKES